MVSDRIRAMGAMHWIVLFAAILAAWLALFAMSIPSDLRIAARIYGTDFWTSFCVVTPDAAGLARVFAMWMLMSGAMMAPTALPAFATYEDIGRQTQTLPLLWQAMLRFGWGTRLWQRFCKCGSLMWACSMLLAIVNPRSFPQCCLGSRAPTSFRR